MDIIVEKKDLVMVAVLSCVEAAYSEIGGLPGLWRRSMSRGIIIGEPDLAFNSYWCVELEGTTLKARIYETFVRANDNWAPQYYNMNAVARSGPNVVACGLWYVTPNPMSEIQREWSDAAAWSKGDRIYFVNTIFSPNKTTCFSFAGLNVASGSPTFEVYTSEYLGGLVNGSEELSRKHQELVFGEPQGMADPRFNIHSIIESNPTGYTPDLSVTGKFVDPNKVVSVKKKVRRKQPKKNHKRK